MKQRITVEQFNQLSKIGKEKLRQYFDARFKTTREAMYLLDFPTIGQMIEFLDEHKKGSWINVFVDWDMEQIQNQNNVCDALWEAVKEILEK